MAATVAAGLVAVLHDNMGHPNCHMAGATVAAAISLASDPCAMGVTNTETPCPCVHRVGTWCPSHDTNCWERARPSEDKIMRVGVVGVVVVVAAVMASASRSIIIHDGASCAGAGAGANGDDDVSVDDLLVR